MLNASRAFAPTMLLAAGSLAGVANATTTINYNLDPTLVRQNISINGTIQYTFGLNQITGTTEFTAFNGTVGTGSDTTAFAPGAVYLAPGLPSASEQFGLCSTFTARTDVASYAHLRFTDNGVTQYGYASFTPTSVSFNGAPTAAARLASITFDAASAVPEPATWAEMIAGLGAVGGAMRTARRRKGQALANA